MEIPSRRRSHALTRIGVNDTVSTALTFETALGTCGLGWSDVGITGVTLPPANRIEACDEAPDAVRATVAAIIALLDGEAADLRWVVLDERAVDPYARRVYAAVREVPPGATASYGEIARAIGAPADARAVGGALARNPFPIVVPCHRVLAADGALHGFSAPGGLATKRRMLEIEGAPGFAQQPLFS